MSLVNGQYRIPAFVIEKLTDTGVESAGAVTNFIGDYSVTPQDAFITAPPGQLLKIEIVNISITDAGSFAPGDYGNILDGLPNGILTVLELDGVEFSNPVKLINTNVELFSIDSAAQIIEYGNNIRTLVARFQLGTPLVLNGDTQDKFILRLSDDMTGILTHEFTVIGEI